jgi:hypothetical protein
MHRVALVLLLGLAALVPALAFEKPLLPAALPSGGPDIPAPGVGGANYQPPKADGPVVELLDEGVDPLFPLLLNDGGGEAGAIAREDRDVFAGVEAVRVTPLQKYRTRIPGWDFKIVEKPEKPGEYRYLRFAWKKSGGPGIMVQFHDPVKSWAMRYYAGQNAVGWSPAKSVSEKVPANWEVVTCDLFQDNGAFNITGIAFTTMWGQQTDYALFDHILLGRSLEGLDKATNEALGKVKPVKPLAGKERDEHWAALLGADRAKATAAIRAFLATAPDQVAFIGQKLAVPEGDKVRTERVRKLIADLDSDDFDTRDAATEGLVKLGAPVIETMRVLAANGPNDELRFRAKVVLKRLGADAGTAAISARMTRVVRVLERAGTKAARELLARMAAGEFGFEGATDAKAVLERWQKTP